MCEVVWDGRGPLTESLDRDYADMRGDGWDVIWEPTSPLTTPWWTFAQWAERDPDRHVAAKNQPKERSWRSKRATVRALRSEIASEAKLAAEERMDSLFRITPKLKNALRRLRKTS